MKRSLISAPIAPNSYLLFDNQIWEPLEYSADDCVLESHKTIIQNQKFLSDWFDVTRKFSLENLLIPAITNRKAWEQEQVQRGDILLETSTDSPAESVIELVSLSPSNTERLISTAWNFGGQTTKNCVLHCFIHCVRQSEALNIVNFYYSL